MQSRSPRPVCATPEESDWYHPFLYFPAYSIDGTAGAAVPLLRWAVGPLRPLANYRCMLRRGSVMVAFGAAPLAEQPIENGARPIRLLLPTIALFVESGA